MASSKFPTHLEYEAPLEAGEARYGFGRVGLTECRLGFTGNRDAEGEIGPNWVARGWTGPGLTPMQVGSLTSPAELGLALITR